jgi:hypothetical protein
MNEALNVVRRIKIKSSDGEIRAEVLMSAPARLPDNMSVVYFSVDPVEPTVRSAFGFDHLQAIENALMLISTLLEGHEHQLEHMDSH